MSTDQSAESLPVHIDQLHLVNFKSYEDARFQFDNGLNFITGVNGSGKTNLLDAVHYICITKSLLTHQDRYNIRDGADFLRLEADISVGRERDKVVARVKPGQLKEFDVNGATWERLSEHIGRYPVIVLSPKDHMLVEGSRTERRRFLDFYLSQTSHEYLSNIHTYNRLLSQRNAHLKEYGRRSDIPLIRAYTERMSAHADVVIGMRRDFVETIKPMVDQRCETLSMRRDHVTLQYLADCPEGALVEMSERSMDRDLALQRTTTGPHRDDLGFEIDAHALKQFGSQGQMKTYLVALHLALHGYIKSRLGKVPIVLLDDIFDKLDDQRSLRLTEILNSFDFGQVLITDARAERIKRICQHFDSSPGIIHIRSDRGRTEEE